MSLRTPYESEVDDTTITVEVEIDKREIETFGELVKTAFRTAMEFGRKLVVTALDVRDEELHVVDLIHIPCGILIHASVQPQGIIIYDKRKIQFDVSSRCPAAGAAQ